MVLILYLGIVLVLMGVIFVVTSVEIVKKPAGRSVVVQKNEHRVTAAPSGTEESSVRENYDEPGIELPENSERSVVLEKDFYEIVMYNDDSGSLNNGIETDKVDPVNIKNINRIGRGIAELGDDGVNIRIDKNLYRFDYYRLDNLDINQNYAVFGIMNMKTRHVVIADDDQFPEILMSKYKKFKEV